MCGLPHGLDPIPAHAGNGDRAFRRNDANWDDPLFRPIDANDFRTNGNAASDYTNLKQGLVRITFPLPAAIKLIDPATNLPSTETTVDVWRSVPPILDVAITGEDNVGLVGDVGQNTTLGPNPRGGYQLDGRILTLEDQALAAFRTHAQTNIDPPLDLLQNIASFEKTQFSSDAVAFQASRILSNTLPFPDPDPVLTPLEQQGKAIFTRSCAQCHGSPDPASGHPSTTTPTVAQRYIRIISQCPRQPIPNAAPTQPNFAIDPGGSFVFPPCPSVVSANARIYEFTNPDNTKSRQTSDDIGRSIFTGRFTDRTGFDTTNLRGISKTAPYFHNNSAATLEEVLDFYQGFFITLLRALPIGLNTIPAVTTDGVHFDRFFTNEEKPALLAYLRKI
jgi:hypothetical protein